MDEREDLDQAALRRRLEDERAALQSDSAQAEDSRRPVTLDQQSVGRLSRMDALQVQAMANAVDARRQVRLRRIDAALARIADGDYGICVTCGEDIPAARLAIDPATPLCVDCAEDSKAKRR